MKALHLSWEMAMISFKLKIYFSSNYFTYTLTPHKATVDKTLVEVVLGWLGLLLPEIAWDLGHLNAGFLQQLEHTGGFLSVKLHSEVTPIWEQHTPVYTLRSIQKGSANALMNAICKICSTSTKFNANLCRKPRKVEATCWEPMLSILSMQLLINTSLSLHL